MRNFSISCATARVPAEPRPRRPPAVVLVAVVVLGALLVAAPVAAKKKDRAPEDLMNPFLGIDYSHWLAGPVGVIATEDEVHDYLALQSDAEAERFIESFWERRAEGTPIFTATPREVYAGRVAEADKRFSEAAFPGHRTDRGLVFVLYGEPESIEFRSPDRVRQPTLEVWVYPKDAAEGLDRQAPRREYRFVDTGEGTIFYDGRMLPPDPFRGRRPGRGF